MSDEVVHEWRVTGEPGEGFPTYSYVWASNTKHFEPGRLGKEITAEEAARSFVMESGPWREGPHLHHRTVMRSEWRQMWQGARP